MKRRVSNLRQDYRSASLDERDAKRDPFDQFKRWLKEALSAALPEPLAMTLATVDSRGRPSARVVLLRGFDKSGLVFYTNYRSAKAKQLQENRRAALVFFWPELERQVRVEGRVKKLPAAQSDRYFQSRPRGSQLGAWASSQSEVLGGRSELNHALAEVQEKFADGPVPRPPFWGGYRVVPERFEFWQGRRDRLHDRIQYRLTAGRWVRERLAP